MRTPTRREWVLLAIVSALVLAAIGAESEGEDPVVAIADARSAGKTQKGAPYAADTGELDLARLHRSARAGEPENVFTPKSWYVPPPPQPPAPPVKYVPPPPKAPPLPFTYLGRYVEAGKPIYFLVKGERVLTVKVGDIIEGSYRVDGVVGSTLGLTYLPLNIKQGLDTGIAG
jgi:hypothetical protein